MLIIMPTTISAQLRLLTNIIIIRNQTGNVPFFAVTFENICYRAGLHTIVNHNYSAETREFKNGTKQTPKLK